ncbi:MAG: PEGA domain-containing protein [Vicinamibacterales bacterium]
MYDPWWYDEPPYAGRYDYGYGDQGSLRLKIKPREATVYVDGYYAGVVDDYDGVFQRLHIDAGPHRIEVRDTDFEPLMFEVRIQPSRTVTYKGTLKPLP